MRVYYEELASLAGFALLAPSLRFDMLVEAIAREYPTGAAKMREWDGLTQRASSPAAREVELWRVHKDSRELRCLAVYMPTGLDLRLMEGEDFRRTQLLKDGPAVEGLAEEWQAKLRAAGWS